MDNPATAPIQGTEPLSTTIDVGTQPGPVGGGQTKLTEKEAPKKPESIGDTLRGELAKAREDEAKKEDKGEKPKAAEGDEKGIEAKADEKPSKEDGKTKKEADKAEVNTPEVTDKAKKDDKPAVEVDKGAAEKPAAERSAPDTRQSEGRKHSEPPARFLPEARGKWANVPNEVKAEFHRVSQEMEGEVGQYKESHENWQKLSKYDQMAKQHNTTVADAMERYTAVDGLLKSNPSEGIRQVLATIGVTPEQYAQYVMKNPQSNQPPQVANTQVAQPQRESPEIASLRQEIEAIKNERHTDQVTPIIQAFASQKSDFNSVWPQMEQIIVSGVIDKIYGAGLSPEQKLSEAYRMAGGSSPSQSDPAAPAEHPAQTPDRLVDPAGRKSVRGAPNGGQEPDNDAPETDIRALLRKEMRKAV